MKSFANLTIACGMLVLFTSVASSQQGIRWMDDVDEARAVAAREGKLLLVHFWSERCGPCKKLDTAVFPRPEVAQAVHANYVPVKVNTDENRALAAAMKVDRIPQDILMSTDGSVLTRQISPNRANLYVNFVNSVASHAATQRERAASAIAATPEARVANNSPFNQPQFRGLQSDRDSIPVVRRGEIDPASELANSPANPLNVQLSDRSGPTQRGRELSQSQNQAFNYPTMPRPDSNLNGANSGNLATRQRGVSQGRIAPRQWDGQSTASAQAPQNGLSRESHNPALQRSSNPLPQNSATSNPYLQNQAAPIAANSAAGLAAPQGSNQQVAYSPQQTQGYSTQAQSQQAPVQPVGQRQSSNNPYAQQQGSVAGRNSVAPPNGTGNPNATTHVRLGDRQLQSPQNYRQSNNASQGAAAVGSPANPTQPYSVNRAAPARPQYNPNNAVSNQAPSNLAPRNNINQQTPYGQATNQPLGSAPRSNNSYLSEQGSPQPQTSNQGQLVAPQAITPAYARPPLHASNPYQRRADEPQNRTATQLGGTSPAQGDSGNLARPSGQPNSQAYPPVSQMRQPRNTQQGSGVQPSQGPLPTQQGQRQTPGQRTLTTPTNQQVNPGTLRMPNQPSANPQQGGTQTAPQTGATGQSQQQPYNPRAQAPANQQDAYLQAQRMVPNQPVPPQRPVGQPGLGQPGLGQPGLGQPGLGQPGLGQQSLATQQGGAQTAQRQQPNPQQSNLRQPSPQQPAGVASQNNNLQQPQHTASRPLNPGMTNQRPAASAPHVGPHSQPTSQQASQSPSQPTAQGQTLAPPPSAGTQPSRQPQTPPRQVASSQPPSNQQAPVQQQSPQVQSQPSQTPPQQVAANEVLPTTALDGYCPVTLVEHRKWVEGDAAFGCIHRGRLYLFTSATNRDRFLQHPDRFAPMLSGYDPVIFARDNRLVEGKRQHGVFSSGRVYMFSSEETLTMFRADIERFTMFTCDAMGITAEHLAAEPDTSGEVNR